MSLLPKRSHFEAEGEEEERRGWRTENFPLSPGLSSPSSRIYVVQSTLDISEVSVKKNYFKVSLYDESAFLRDKEELGCQQILSPRLPISEVDCSATYVNRRARQCGWGQR